MLCPLHIYNTSNVKNVKNGGENVSYVATIVATICATVIVLALIGTKENRKKN